MDTVGPVSSFHVGTLSQILHSGGSRGVAQALRGESRTAETSAAAVEDYELVVVGRCTNVRRRLRK